MTQNLVDALEAQHRMLQKAAEELDTALAKSDAALAGQKLTTVRHLLTSHLQLEEAQFYPELHAHSAGQDSLQATVTLFQTNMKTIAGTLEGFFERYEGKPLDLASFAPAWRNTVRTLIERMEQEEERLHPLFQRLKKH